MTGALLDLARERRIGAAVREIRDLVDGDLDRQARTAAMLGGALPVPDLDLEPDHGDAMPSKQRPPSPPARHYRGALDADASESLPPARTPTRRSAAPESEPTPSTNVRLSRDLLDRADALAPLIAAHDPRLSAVAGADGLSRGAVLRLAIVEGLDVLEARHVQTDAERELRAAAAKRGLK